MNYNKVSKYLDDCLVFGIKPSLVRIKKILDLLGNPHKRHDFIHIVGTNGKTSTTKILAHILYGHNIKSGYYISPHINSYVERMWISGNEISEDRFVKLFEDIYPCIEKVNQMDLDGPMTQFEILTAMAFKLGEDENLDVMVLEAGMGGRWDATNAADSKVVGLTGVSLEHTKILGDSIAKIASEKVEVVKRKALVATLSKNKKVLDVLKRKINETDSRLFVFGEDFKILKAEKEDLCGWRVDISGVRATYNNLRLPLLGVFQPFNLCLAFVLAELYLGTYNKELQQDLVNKSLLSLRVEGRFEIIKRDPLVVLDASHNPEGIKILVKNLEEYFDSKRKVIIFGVLRDKDYKKMISYILGISDILILTSSLTIRSLDIDSLEDETKKIIDLKRKKGEKIPLYIYKIDNIKNSLNFALKISKSSDIICITGSITNLENIS